MCESRAYASIRRQCRSPTWATHDSAESLTHEPAFELEAEVGVEARAVMAQGPSDQTVGVTPTASVERVEHTAPQCGPGVRQLCFAKRKLCHDGLLSLPSRSKN